MALQGMGTQVARADKEPVQDARHVGVKNRRPAAEGET
jgi:hypothetical protein|tara:strand:- start:720 stop:833 length:114 start_codon:yes stop_codon:yes gene_type:complete